MELGTRSAQEAGVWDGGPTHWDEVVTQLGYEHLVRHDLRHTGLTWMADAGEPQITIGVLTVTLCVVLIRPRRPRKAIEN